jgi:hypothetical protein
MNSSTYQNIHSRTLVVLGHNDYNCEGIGEDQRKGKFYFLLLHIFSKHELICRNTTYNQQKKQNNTFSTKEWLPEFDIYMHVT